MKWQCPLRFDKIVKKKTPIFSCSSNPKHPYFTLRWTTSRDMAFFNAEMLLFTRI